MRHLRLIFVTLVCVGAATGGFIACVGDAPVTGGDGGGPDATSDNNVVPQPDASVDAPSTDAEAGLGPAPTPDGGLVWLNHYNSNQGFNDLVVNENGSLTYVVAGSFLTDPNAGNQFHFGSVNLGPAPNVDLFSGAVTGTGTALWGKSAATTTNSGTNVDSLTAVAVDSLGNVYAFGSSMSATVTLKDTLVGPTSFIVKLSPTGTPLWEHPYTSQSSTVTGPVSLGVSGSSLVVAMTYYTSVTYDTGKTVSSQGGSDVFVTSLDTNTGSTQWTESFGSSGNDSVTQIAMTPQGDAILVGPLMADMSEQDAGFSLPLIGDAGTGTDLYVIKISASGTPLYGLTYGDPASWVHATGVAYRNGTIAIAAGFGGSVDFGKGTLTSTSADGVVFTIDEATKKTNFSAQLAGTAYDSFTSVAIDPWGEVVATGTYGVYSPAAAQIGSQALPQTSISVAGMVLAKWNASGTLLWTHAYVPTLNGGGAPYSTPDAANGQQSVVGMRVQTTSTGVIVLTGSMTGGTDFGQGYQAPLSTIQTLFKCGGTPTCYLTNTCKYCPGVPTDGLIGTWSP